MERCSSQWQQIVRSYCDCLVCLSLEYSATTWSIWLRRLCKCSICWWFLESFCTLEILGVLSVFRSLVSKYLILLNIAVEQCSIEYCFGFTLLRSVIGPENWRLHLNQSNTKLKPTSTRWLAFSRASSRLPTFTSSSHRLMIMLAFVLIDSCDYVGFGFFGCSVSHKNLL